MFSSHFNDSLRCSAVASLMQPAAGPPTIPNDPEGSPRESWFIIDNWYHSLFSKMSTDEFVGAKLPVCHSVDLWPLLFFFFFLLLLFCLLVSITPSPPPWPPFAVHPLLIKLRFLTINFFEAFKIGGGAGGQGRGRRRRRCYCFVPLEFIFWLFWDSASDWSDYRLSLLRGGGGGGGGVGGGGGNPIILTGMNLSNTRTSLCLLLLHQY